MANLTFKFTDAQMISKPEKTDISVWKDSLGSSYSGSRKALRVTFEATHAAFINRNIRWYSPSKMNDGALTFLNGNKPAKVLKHHKSDTDPVGVVRGSRFIATIPEDLQDNPDVLTLMSETSDMKDQIKSMKRLIKSGVTSRPDWKGLGYIELVADIFDSESIDQINDGRFDAVSTSFRSPGHAYCFICGQNWGQDGICEHSQLGEVYEDEDENEWPMMLVPGLHLYDEVSLVVKDADPLTAIEISDSQENGESQLIDYEDAWEDNLPAFTCKFEFKDSIEEDKPMKKKLSDKAEAILAIIKPLRPKAEEKVLADFASKISELQLEDGSFKGQSEAGIDEGMAVKYLLETLENADKEVDAKTIYSVMADKLKDEEKLEDEAIAKLSDSTFCGPNRSFPCPDAAHVKAAIEVIESVECVDKINTLIKLNKKTVAIGEEAKADKQKSGEEITFVMPASADDLKDLSDNEVLLLCALSDQTGAVRNLKMKAECSQCAENLTKTETALKEAEIATAKCNDALNTVAVLREELKFQQSDYVHQVDKFITLETELRTAKEEKLAIVGTLVGKYKSNDSALESLKESDIVALEASIMDGFDIVAAANKLNDGMTQTPKKGEEVLTSPAVIVDGDNLQLPEGLSGPGEAAFESIRDMLSYGDENGAQTLFDRMKLRNVFPEELTIETISAASAE